MAIENRYLEPGTRLIAKYRKDTYYALVVTGEGGKVLYQLPDGKEFKSTSALGTAITGKSCNGWSFWSVDTGEPFEAGTTTETTAPTTADAEEPTEEDSEPETIYVAAGEEFTGPTDRPKFHRVANQKGVDPGQVRLHCYTCKNSFIVPNDKNPESCPAGHQPS